MLKCWELEESSESEANDVMVRSGSHDSKHVDQIASHLGHTQTHKHTYTIIPPTWPTTTPIFIHKHVSHPPRTWVTVVFPWLIWKEWILTSSVWFRVQFCHWHDLTDKIRPEHNCGEPQSLYATVWNMQRTRLSNRRRKIRKLKCDGRTAKGRPPWLSLPRPLSGCLSGCLPLSLRQPLHLLLLHRDVKLIVDAWVLLVENDLESKTGSENRQN